MELCGSVTALGDNGTYSTKVAKVIFTVKNAVDGSPIDMTPCDGTSSATNKCVISLTTKNDYKNNVKWSEAFVGNSNSNNLLETGEQCQVTIDLNDLGLPGALNADLVANDTFSLQVKPSVGASITIQRSIPASVGAVMDLDLGTSFGGTGARTGGTTPSSPLICRDVTVASLSAGGPVWAVYLDLRNTGAVTLNISQSGVTMAVNGGSAVTPYWEVFAGNNPIWAQYNCMLELRPDLSPVIPLTQGDTFTITITPDGGSALVITRTIPNPLASGSTDLY